MTILLVDDELQLRNYLRTLVDWEGHGYRFMEAENGAAAIEMMKRTQINLLMLDITMPVMSGLEVLDWIQENRYDCVTAMLTSHDEFGYAQKALRMGCADYILKSDITGETILALADRMRQNLAEEIKQQQRHAAMETAARRKEMLEIQNTVNYWLKKDGSGELDIASYLEQKLGFTDHENRYVLLYIQIHDYDSVVSRYTASDVVRFSAVFDGVLRELLEGHKFFYTECDAGEFLVFLRFGLADSAHDLLNKMRGLTSRIDASFTGLLGIRGWIVHTLPFIGIDSAIERYGRLKSLRDFSFWNPESGVTCLEDYVFDEQICGRELGGFAKEFAKELESRSLFRIEMAYGEMADKIAGHRYCISPGLFKNTCVSCAAVFLRNQTRENTDFSPLFVIESCTAFKSALLELVRPYCIFEGDHDKAILVKKAMLLIQQHYRENIGLEWLAQKLYVNASYLSRVFSAEAGQPAIQYLNACRVEEAKRLIRTENMKFYEVAERTGFASSVVFSSVFKKITGETPSEYKSRSV